jgi:uncharacterized membrane protein YdbT with pleckstrin-like domain
MGFPKKLLADHEEMVLDLRPHWIALALPLVVTTLVLVAWFVLFLFFDPPGVVSWTAIIAGILILIAFPVRALLAWLTSHFVVTSDRVIHRSGWLAKRSMEIPLERINDVRFEQSVFERVVGAGDLRIESGGEYGQNHFSDIRRPEDVQKLIYEMSEENQNRMMRSEPATATAEAATRKSFSTGASPLDEIERLAALKDRGLLSEEEFETQKRRLLGRL